MPLLEWSDEYSVHVKELDDQHKNLFDLVNLLYDSIDDGNDKEILRPVLDRLLDYIAYHFGSEESLLQKYEFAEERRHKKEHDEFSWKVLNMRGRWSRGEDLQIAEVQNFLSDWIKNHILRTDKKYSAFLNSKGIH